jgi:hypothetical protein
LIQEEVRATVMSALPAMIDPWHFRDNKEIGQAERCRSRNRELSGGPRLVFRGCRNNPNGDGVYGRDGAGQPDLLASDSFLSSTGYDRGEVLGKSFNLLMAQGSDAEAQLALNQG